VEENMSTYLRRIGIAAVAALSLATATVAGSSSASAQRFHGGWHGGGWHGGGWHGGGWHGRGFGFGPAVVGGLALGALAGSAYYYGGPYGYYDDDCFARRRIVGYTPWGRPIVRLVSSCY
jgi:hypothetical protein